MPFMPYLVVGHLDGSHVDVAIVELNLLAVRYLLRKSTTLEI
jgi:hypothetical protein